MDIDGAFTGATKGGKAGLFEISHGGTIFLDEISEIPYEIQGQLLRVLQEKEIRRLGSDVLTPINIRVIAASNKPLAVEVSEKRFREDLFYRINILNIDIPPLRKRTEDIESIALSMFQRYSGDKYNEFKDFFCHLLQSIEDYDWPGNVRELNNFVEKVSALINHYDNINEIRAIVEQDYIKEVQQTHENMDFLDLKNWEYTIIVEALKRNKLVVTKTAEDIGMSRSTLIRKIKKYNIEV